MVWFKLTTPNGHPVQINADQLARVRFPEGETDKAAKAIVDLANGQSQATQESPDQIMAMIEGRSVADEVKAAPVRRARRDPS
jgi:hypothetical protein